jgi:hypothetical protein
LISLYYKGLKDYIKDELMHLVRLDTLRAFIEQVRELAVRLEKRKKERKERWILEFSRKERTNKSTMRSSYLGSRPIEGIEMKAIKGKKDS